MKNELFCGKSIESMEEQHRNIFNLFHSSIKPYAKRYSIGNGEGHHAFLNILKGDPF